MLVLVPEGREVKPELALDEWPQQPNSLSDLGGWGMTTAQTTTSTPAANSTLQFRIFLEGECPQCTSCQQQYSTNTIYDDNDNGLLRGGTAGAGLNLTAPQHRRRHTTTTGGGLWSLLVDPL
jgi:hypothetical protein